MPKPKNEPIGEVVCPAKGCELTIPVFRFKPRADEKQQRFANKVYCRCPVHGSFGGAPGDDAMQDYITENATKCEQQSAGAAPEKKPQSPARAPEKPPEQVPAPTPASRPDLWDM